MITLLENEALPFFSKISFVQTSCLNAAYRGSALEPDIWVQRMNGRITAVISRLGGRLNITSKDADFEEIKKFIKIIGYTEIFCETDVALGLGFDSFEEFCVLKGQAKKTKDFCDIPPLYDLYTALSWGEDGEISLPDFDIFAPDISHRLRHNSAVAVALDFGGGLALKCDDGSVISGISVKKEQRGRGLGSLLLCELLKYLEGEVFVCTDDKTARFYIKNGFVHCDKAALIRG